MRRRRHCGGRRDQGHLRLAARGSCHARRRRLLADARLANLRRLRQAGIDHLRVGEGILLPDAAFLSVFRGAFYRKPSNLSALVIEDRIRPARPYGLAGKDAFGRTLRFDQVPDGPMRRQRQRQRRRRRLLLAIGEEDIRLAGLQPDDERLRLIGAGSDHLVLDASAVGADYPLGQRIRFSLDHGALLTAMTSPYVEKRCLDPR